MAKKRQGTLFLVLISTILTGPYVNAQNPHFQQTDVFAATGRAHFRIPSMVVAKDGLGRE